MLKTPLRQDLPRWCYDTPSNTLEAMAAQEYPRLDIPFFGIAGPVYWSDLIAAAQERERRQC